MHNAALCDCHLPPSSLPNVVETPTSILDLLRATNIWKKRKLFSLTQLSVRGEKNGFGFSVDDGKENDYTLLSKQ